MEIFITAPETFGNDYITEPHVVKQIWKDALGETPVPRVRENWIAITRALRTSIEQDGYLTTFEVPGLPSHDDISTLLHRVLHCFIKSRSPSDQYVARRYHYRDGAAQAKKRAEVDMRIACAAMMSEAVNGANFVLPGIPGIPVKFEVAKSWDDIPVVRHNPEDVQRALAVGEIVPGDHCFSLISPPKKIGPFPMREDKPVQPISEAITESLNRVKKTLCRHCEEEVFWVKTPDGKHFLADNFEQQRELVNIDGDGNTEAGQKHILCIPHVCPAMAERVRWPKGKRPAHPLKERLWALLVQSGVQGGAAQNLIDTAFKPEVMIPVKRVEGAAFGKATQEKRTVINIPAPRMPTQEWGIIREMAQLLRETADRGSELNLEDRKRLNVTADLADAAIVDNMKEAITLEIRGACEIEISDGDPEVSAARIQEELAKLQALFEENSRQVQIKEERAFLEGSD